MPVLKQQPSAPLIRDAVVLDLGDLGRQAAKLRAAAEARAEQILADARAEAQRIIAGAEAKGLAQGQAEGLTQGLEEGRAQGHAEALAAGAESIQQATAAFTAVAEQWDVQRTALDRDARQQVLTFALRFAEKLTHRVIETDEHVIVDQLAAAMARVLEPSDVAVRIHPDDRPTLTEALPDLLGKVSKLQHVELVDDPTLDRGGCVLGLAGGEVDASIDTQLRRIVEVMLPGMVVGGQESVVGKNESDEPNDFDPPPET
jgi:flagellar biosynthesis/type III secretory pathway protein FliH